MRLAFGFLKEEQTILVSLKKQKKMFIRSGVVMSQFACCMSKLLSLCIRLLVVNAVLSLATTGGSLSLISMRLTPLVLLVASSGCSVVDGLLRVTSLG